MKDYFLPSLWHVSFLHITREDRCAIFCLSFYRLPCWRSIRLFLLKKKTIVICLLNYPLLHYDSNITPSRFVLANFTSTPNWAPFSFHSALQTRGACSIWKHARIVSTVSDPRTRGSVTWIWQDSAFHSYFELFYHYVKRI